MSNRFPWLSMALSSCLVTCTTHAAWAPRVTGVGQMGEYGSLWGDGLFPVQDASRQVVFFDFQAETNRFYSSNAFSGIVSPGLGMRHAFSNDDVLGIYLFSDYMMTNVKQNYWFLSPGVDFYRGRGYAALNTYIPVDNAPRKIGSLGIASDMGITQYETLVGNSQYDHLIDVFDSMRWGMDLTGGVLFGDKNEWGVKVGAYLYDSQHLNTIGGGRGELDYYINDSVVLTIEERYDNVFHNQIVMGIKISFLGTDNRGSVKTQLKAPIYRNLNINTTSAGTPIGEYQQASAQSYLIQDNITFVSNGGGLGSSMLSAAITGDGTYEHPYTGLDQDIINNITKNSNIWVEGTGASRPYSDAATLTLQSGQAIYGRTDGFRLAALSASTQPIFNFSPTAGTAAFYIDNTNVLQNLIMHRSGGATDSIGVEVGNTGSGTALIKGVTIGTTAVDTGYATALYNQGGNVSINQSGLYAITDTVTASSSGPTAQGVFGLYNNGGSVALTNSTVSATVNNVNYNSDVMGMGISAGSWGVYNATQGVATIKQSEVDVQANNVRYDFDDTSYGVGDSVGAFGLYNNESTMTLSNSTVRSTANNVIDYRTPTSTLSSSIIGAFGLYNTKGTMTVIGTTSSINAIATGVDNKGADSGQGLLDYVGAFGAYNDGGAMFSNATLDIKQAHLTTSATTVSTSIFSSNDPALSAVGVWNNVHGGTASTTIGQGAKIDVDAIWQIKSISSQQAAVYSLGFYNEADGGTANLTTNAAIVTATQTGGDGGFGGGVAGGENGSIYSNANGGIAVTTITGATHILANGSGAQMNAYGFENNADYNLTDGTIIEGGSTIASAGDSLVTSTAVYNVIYGNMAIQGTADHPVILTANGGNNVGVLNYNGATMTINGALIQVSPSMGAGNDTDGVFNESNSTITIQNTTVTVSSLPGSPVYGVHNQGASTANVSNSIFNMLTSGAGNAYGLWNDGAGDTTNILSSTVLNFNYDESLGNASAFSLAGTYTGEGNVVCKYNGVLEPCS